MSGQDGGRTYPIATICGTMRLHQDMLTVADELTRQGHIVLLPLSRKDGSSLHTPSPITADELDALHRAKIDMADVVVFVTQEQQHLIETDSTALYFGESTRAEWAYAESLNKVIKVVRLQRHAYRDTVIWIDNPCLDSSPAAVRAAGTTAQRTVGRRTGRPQPRRAASAHTFRID